MPSEKILQRKKDEVVALTENRSFYAIEHNLCHLADILGHSSIETTRIYVAASTRQHERTLRKMKLVI